MVVNGEEQICRDSKCEYTADPKENISVFVTGTLDGGCSLKYEEATGETCCYAKIQYDERCESNNNSDTCLKVSINETKNEKSEPGCLLTLDNQGNNSNLTVHVEFPLRPDLDKIIILMPIAEEARYYWVWLVNSLITMLLFITVFGILFYIRLIKPNFETAAAKNKFFKLLRIPWLLLVILAIWNCVVSFF